MSPDRRASLAVVLAIPVAVALVLALSAWPAARLAPRDLPVGVAGPAPAARDTKQRLAQQEGAFEVHLYANEASAREAIRNREVYGAFVVGPGGPAVFTASAASPVVAQLLQQTATERRDAPGGGAGRVRVVDVVPAASHDPRGAALNASVLPLVLAGIVTAILAAALVPPGLRQMAALLIGAVLAGLTAVAIAQGWLGVIDGGWLGNAAALSLMVFAIAAAVAGLKALFGHIGLAFGAVLMILIGNPFSGVSSAPELLPQPVGTIGQLLPPGAGGNLLRSSAFFDGNRSGVHVIVLGVWALLGLAAVGAAGKSVV